jgi:hypothetical protein
MALLQKTINIGIVANDGTGDPLRSAFGTVNENFTNLYTEVSKLPAEGLSSRVSIVETTPVLAAGATADINLNAYKGYMLYKIETNAACWARIYVNGASRTADSSRTIEEDPQQAAGLITEIVTDGPGTILFAPALHGYNGENPPSNTMPIKITNLTAENRSIELTITILKMEI